MKKRIFIGILSLFLATWILYSWYSHIPPMSENTKNIMAKNQENTKISGNFIHYRDQQLLLYGIGEKPEIHNGTIKFIGGVWLIRSIDPTIDLAFSGRNISGTIHSKGTIFLDIEKNTMLSIDASLVGQQSEKIPPSFYMLNGKIAFFDLGSIEAIIPKDLWKFYRDNALKDEQEVFSGFSETEIIKNIDILLMREPDKKNSGSVFFKKDLHVRILLEDINNYLKETRKEKKCGNNPVACSKFITDSIRKGKIIDPTIFEGLEDPLLMWVRKNSNPDASFSWESVFQKYHLNVLSGNPLAINIRDSSILEMIRSSDDPTYEMWLYLTFILGKEKNGSPYSLKIMTEMIRLGEILKSGEHQDAIVKASNDALSHLKKVLEDTYFEKQDDYVFVLKQNLKDSSGQNLDTKIFVNDLNALVVEIDKSTLFLEYPDFRILRRHLVWFTCIFSKNQEYLQDIRICRAEV
ncbi:MAG: hypothetical protein WC753_00080 [Candidatus Gracilibacteria bacterium]